MKNVLAKPIDMIDLIAFYDTNNPTFTTYLDSNERNPNCQMKKKERSGPNFASSTLDVYELLTFFIEENMRLNTDSHFIIDEVPIFIDGIYFGLYLLIADSLNNSFVI